VILDLATLSELLTFDGRTDGQTDSKYRVIIGPIATHGNKITYYLSTEHKSY